MSLIYPSSRSEISDRMKTDVKSELPNSDPFLRASIILTQLIAYSNALFDLYTTIKNLQNELFPDTATDEFADRWGGFKGITRNPASQSEGLATATGIAGTLIPSATLLQTTDGNQYESLSDYTVNNSSISITTLTRSSNTATVTTASDHFFGTGQSITISGVDQTDYNGLFTIVVTGLNKFTYSVTGSPTTPATGTMLATSDFASMTIKSVDFGANTNLDGGTQLSFITPIAGIDQTVYVQYEGIEGGVDEESDVDFDERYLEAYRDPIANFNKAEVIATAKEVPGVTRVFVFSATPQPGEATINFMRDNDANAIPTVTEVAEVKAKLLTIKPVEMEDSSLIVAAPTPVTVDFTFTALSPNTTTMQQAITENLSQFFKEETEVGVDVQEDGYRSAIINTIDLNNGQTVNSFSLSGPVGNVSIATGEIGVLGTVTYL